MSEQTVAAGIERAVKAYIQACNDGDAETIAACFGSDAVHYFPTGPKWSGASTIGVNFSKRVRDLATYGRSIRFSLTQIDAPLCLSGRSSQKTAAFFVESIGSFSRRGRSVFRRFALMAPRQYNPTWSARNCGILITLNAAIR